MGKGQALLWPSTQQDQRKDGIWLLSATLGPTTHFISLRPSFSSLLPFPFFPLPAPFANETSSFLQGGRTGLKCPGLGSTCVKGIGICWEKNGLAFLFPLPLCHLAPATLFFTPFPSSSVLSVPFSTALPSPHLSVMAGLCLPLSVCHLVKCWCARPNRIQTQTLLTYKIKCPLMIQLISENIGQPWYLG